MPEILQNLECKIHDDGCIVCSDAGIPARIIELRGEDALCEDSSGEQVEIAVDLVAPVSSGDLVLVHGGVAIARVMPEPALAKKGSGENEVR
jgi:hydrogenase expression/formation protein HypC